MMWKTIAGADIPDVKADLKTAESFGAVRISGQAVYLSGHEYLPLTGIQRARLYASRMNTHGCCGLGLPVWYVLLYHDGAEQPVKLLAETKEKAERVLGSITERAPSIEVMEAHEA